MKYSVWQLILESFLIHYQIDIPYSETSLKKQDYHRNSKMSKAKVMSILFQYTCWQDITGDRKSDEGVSQDLYKFLIFWN